ncbi:MAG: hypothetical protein ACP5QR_12685 [Rhizomicrobium sp.]
MILTQDHHESDPSPTGVTFRAERTKYLVEDGSELCGMSPPHCQLLYGGPLPGEQMHD